VAVDGTGRAGGPEILLEKNGVTQRDILTPRRCGRALAPAYGNGDCGIAYGKFLGGSSKRDKVFSKPKSAHSLSIPESIALRVRERLGHKALQANLSSGNPLRVIRLRDLDTGVAKQVRKILKLHSSN
jgi:hypothetical protein